MRCSCGQKNPPEARFCMACGQALGVTLPRERRWVSVVFFDLVGSTRGFQKGLHPTYEAVQETLTRAAQAARAHGGHVHAFPGDGVLVLFGAPRARGLEAHRALEAALAMVRGSPWPARAGVASGEVLWTPLGDGLAGRPTAVGPVVALAERLSKAAPTGSVLADPATLDLAPGAKAHLLGEEALPGVGPFPLLQVDGVGLQLTPEEEALLDALERDLRTQRRALLTGPPGSGKSFLLEAFLRRKAPGMRLPVAVLERMGPETPLRESLKRAAEELFGEAEGALEGLEGEERTALAYSLGLGERPPWPREVLEERILQAWTASLARLGPFLLVLKDLHLPDRTLARFLERPPEGLFLLVESRKPLWAPYLALKRTRPPLPWTLQPALDGLPHRERKALLALGVLGRATPALLEELVGPFDGRRLEAEGLIRTQGAWLLPLPEVGQAARGLVLEEEAHGWRREAAQGLLAQGAYLLAARLLEEAGEGEKAARVYRALAHAAWNRGHPERALSLYERALRAAPEAMRPALERERQDAQASLGLGEGARGGLRAKDPALEAYRRLRKAPSAPELANLLPALKPYPLEATEARLLLAGLLWRGFQPQLALAHLPPPHPHLPPALKAEVEALRAGLLMDLGRHKEAGKSLKTPPPPEEREAWARFQATRLRLLLETGRLHEALALGEAAYRQAPHPWLAAALLAASTLRGRFRIDLLEEAHTHPDGRALAALAQALERWRKGLDPRPLLKEALKAGRTLPNPYVYHLTLSTLSLYLWPQSPRKAKALSQHLLYHTHKTGFAVQLELARLLRAQLLLEEGEGVGHLLGFTPSLPFLQAWRAYLLRASGGGGWEERVDPKLRGYGILGEWVRRLWGRGRPVWTWPRR
ncbi:AAA family ATPase [Thermus oshimai]|uniref:AAA family ATPase n=1 Tax=Thermus oshimai TaxID=56957 RepID=UPI0039A70199